MTEKLLNCWEYMRCGRESHGAHSDQRGICPATIEQGLDKVHGGRNAGRACWAVAGSFQGRTTHGTSSGRHGNCKLCDFYKLVRKEEGDYFWPTDLLFKLLGKKRPGHLTGFSG